MATTIITKFGSGAPAASDVVRGELAVDTENGRLYTENIAGSVVEIGLNPSGNVDVTGTVTTTGNVGIGTTPSFPLDVLGSSTISGRVKTSGALNAFYMEDSGTTASTLYIGSVGDDWRVVTGSNERLRVDSDGKVGIGTSSPSTALTVSGGFDASTAGSKPSITGAGNYGGGIGFVDTNVSGMYTDTSGANLKFFTNQSGSDAAQNKVAMTIDGSGNVGIGQAPTAFSNWKVLELKGGTNGALLNYVNSGGTRAAALAYDDSAGALRMQSFLNPITFEPNGSEAARFDSSGNLLVGMSTASTTVDGLYLRPGTNSGINASSSHALTLNRRTDDGDILKFTKDGTTVGSIGTSSADLTIGTGDTGLYFWDGDNGVIPWNVSTNSARDNLISLGTASNRFDDAFITNGVTTGSDRNQKQDIEALSDAEQRVAVACKALLRKWRWKDAVEAKGDDARIHFGIIAQDLQAAFEAEGLDAGRYAMFMSNTWTDEETGEERTRLGVRYHELLAFIIAAI